MSEKPRLEDLLDMVPRLGASTELRRRVFEIPARQPRTALPAWLGWFVGRRGVAFALLLVGLGALGGVATAEDETMAAPESESEQWQEASELALGTEFSEDF